MCLSFRIFARKRCLITVISLIFISLLFTVIQIPDFEDSWSNSLLFVRRADELDGVPTTSTSPHKISNNPNTANKSYKVPSQAHSKLDDQDQEDKLGEVKRDPKPTQKHQTKEQEDPKELATGTAKEENPVNPVIIVPEVPKPVDSAPRAEEGGMLENTDIRAEKPRNISALSANGKQLTIEEIDTFYLENKEGIEETLNKRRQQMLSVCKSIPNHRGFNRPFLFHFKELKLSWCPTYKAGSTTWKDYFVKRFVDAEIQNPTLDKLWKFRLSASLGKPVDGRKKYRKETPDSIRITVVRHPIVRIISYWKMARGCGEFTRVGMHKDVILQRSLPTDLLSFKDKFVEEVGDYYDWCQDEVSEDTSKERRPKPTPSPDNPFLNPPHITFPELVQKMEDQRKKLKKNDWEGHWAPASEWCDVCVHQLDYVAKLEKEPWELWYILDKVGLWEDREEFLGFHNMASDTGRPSNEDEMSKYVALLSDSQKQFLNTFYKNDFEMFGYTSVS